MHVFTLFSRPFVTKFTQNVSREAETESGNLNTMTKNQTEIHSVPFQKVRSETNQKFYIIIIRS